MIDDNASSRKIIGYFADYKILIFKPSGVQISKDRGFSSLLFEIIFEVI